jgi:hypothetical protein
MWDNIAQAGIMSFGVISIFLVAIGNRWGFIFGLASQPFWYITSIINHQWGVVGVSIFYTISWGIGVYRNFFRK